LKTPVEALQEKVSQINPDVAGFPPFILDRIDLSAAELTHLLGAEVGRMDPLLSNEATMRTVKAMRD
jgi:hypothetical protein